MSNQPLLFDNDVMFEEKSGFVIAAAELRLEIEPGAVGLQYEIPVVSHASFSPLGIGYGEDLNLQFSNSPERQASGFFKQLGDGLGVRLSGLIGSGILKLRRLPAKGTESLIRKGLKCGVLYGLKVTGSAGATGELVFIEYEAEVSLNTRNVEVNVIAVFSGRPQQKLRENASLPTPAGKLHLKLTIPRMSLFVAGDTSTHFFSEPFHGQRSDPKDLLFPVDVLKYDGQSTESLLVTDFGGDLYVPGRIALNVKKEDEAPSQGLFKDSPGFIMISYNERGTGFLRGRPVCRASPHGLLAGSTSGRPIFHVSMLTPKYFAERLRFGATIEKQYREEHLGSVTLVAWPDAMENGNARQDVEYLSVSAWLDANGLNVALVGELGPVRDWKLNPERIQIQNFEASFCIPWSFMAVRQFVIWHDKEGRGALKSAYA